MKKVLKKIFKTLVASTIILFVGLVIVLLINIIEHFCPILLFIIGIGLLLFMGYYISSDKYQ